MNKPDSYLDKIEAIAFESTNETKELPMYKYWFRKGFKLGQSETMPSEVRELLEELTTDTTQDRAERIGHLLRMYP